MLCSRHYYARKDPDWRAALSQGDEAKVREQAAKIVLYSCRRYNEWHDINIVGALGIDMYSHPFDHEAGYQVIRQGAVTLCMYHLERGNELIPTVVSDLVGRKLRVERGNSHTKKYSADELKLAMDCFPWHLPQVVDTLNGKTARHFGYC